MLLSYAILLVSLAIVSLLVVLVLDLRRLDRDLEFLVENSLKKSAVPPPNRLILLRSLGNKFRNLAYRHRRTTKLRRLRDLDWRVLIDGMSEMVLIAKNDGRIMERNFAFERFFSSSEEAETIDELNLPGQFDLSLQEFFKKDQDQEDPLELVTEFEREGRKKYLWVRSYPIKNASGRKVATLFLMGDLTRQREADERRREFVFNASHQLRTPLTLIQGYLETLLESEELDLYTRKAITQRAHNGAIELGSIMTDLLLLTKVEQQEESLVTESVCLSQLVQEVVKSLETLSHEKSLSFETNLFAFEVAVERELMKQALHNVVENAIKYSPDKGVVRLRMRTVSGGVEFLVADQGIGVAQGDQKKIFNRFYRSENGRSQKPGTGLGLSITRHICTRHGVDVSLSSNQERGAEFKFTWKQEASPEA